MKLTFLGAAHEVTGSCTLLEANGKKILIDCGMEQGADIYENQELPCSPAFIDAILLTHAHIDHSGLVPQMVARGYDAPIYSTEATERLCDIMLRDSAYIQESEAEWKSRKSIRAGGEAVAPLYTVADAEKAMSLFEGRAYNKPFELFDGISVEFCDAGHLLGSASIHITVNEAGESRSILFSGDLGNRARPLIRDPQPPKNADFVVIESTYGDRIHGERPDYIGQLTDIFQETFDKGGNVIIPSFAIGRTQELLYLIRILKEQGLVRGHGNFPVYVDSPLAVEATRIYQDGLYGYYDSETLELLNKGINPIDFSNIRLSVSADDSKKINLDETPKVIISASGMCEAGRIRHHLKHNLWREESTVLFVGYQADGTLGRKLIDGAKSVSLFNEEIAVNARIASIVGISGHADRDMMLEWLAKMPVAPKRIFVNHGEDMVCESFAQTIYNKLAINACAPFSGDEYDLIAEEFTAQGKIVKVSKISDGRRRANIAFDKLLSAGKRLLTIIGLSKNSMTNKEMAKFTDQIHDLCDKYAKKTKE